MIPLGTDVPQRRTPWMNWAIIATCFLIYFISNRNPFSLQPTALSPGWNRFMLQPLNLRIYQFITYQFLHADLLHIGGNMLFLWVFGNMMNEKLGHLPYLLFYLAGGILAGCGQALTSSAPTLGASGSIAAVVGLFLVLAPLVNIRVWFFFIFDIPSIFFVAFQIVFFDVLGTLHPSDVAHYAHLTGYATGLIVGVILLTAGLVERDHYDILALLNRWRRRRTYKRLIARGYNPFSSAPPPSAASVTAAAQPQVVKVMPPPDPRVIQLRDAVLQLRRGHQLSEASRRYLELRQIDPRFVLPAEAQLDISNQFMADGLYREAADGYEDYLARYPTGSDADQVHLILALIYARYHSRPQRAIELLQKVLTRLHDPRQRDLAQQELEHLQATGSSPGASDSDTA